MLQMSTIKLGDLSKKKKQLPMLGNIASASQDMSKHPQAPREEEKRL